MPNMFSHFKIMLVICHKTTDKIIEFDNSNKHEERQKHDTITTIQQYKYQRKDYTIQKG